MEIAYDTSNERTSMWYIIGSDTNVCEECGQCQLGTEFRQEEELFSMFLCAEHFRQWLKRDKDMVPATSGAISTGRTRPKKENRGGN